MMRMNSKGQGFDVFKLLIAAVVAGAILLILLQTLQVLPTPGGRDPNELAAENVKSQVNNIGLPKFVENVTFKKGDPLSAKTIAEKSKSLSKEQVCVVSTSSTPNQDNFKGTNGQTVEYIGSFDQRVRLVVICDRVGELGGDEGSLAAYESLAELGVVDAFESDCDVDALDSESSRMCLIAVVSE